MKEITYLAIDPGERNGLCGYNLTGKLLWMRTIHYDNLARFLEDIGHVQMMVMEDYKVFPNKAKDHVYSDLIAARAIGKVESWSERYSVRIVKQGSKFLSIGFKYLGRRPPPKPDRMNDPWCAHAHFTYWAVNNGIIHPKELL